MLSYFAGSKRGGWRVLWAVSALALTCIWILGVGAGTALARERREKPKTKQVQTVSQQTGKLFTKAQEFLAEEQYAESLAMLDRIKSKGRKLNTYEQALMYQLYGYVYSSQEKYKQAASNFEKCLAVGALQEVQAMSLKYALGQIYIATGNYAKGIETLESWFNQAQNPNPSAYVSLASAYLQTDKAKKAVVLMEKALSLTDAPQENWLNIAFASYYQVRDYKKGAGILEQLVERYPKKNYLIQLAAIYGSLKQDKHSLAVMEAAYQHGYLTKDSEVRRMAEMFLYNELPYKGAKVLDQGIKDGVVEKNEKNWYLLGNAWMQAKEFDRAEHPLREAAKLSKDGKIYRLLGQLAYEKEDWKAARKALELALKKGGFKNEGQVYLMLGLVDVNLEDYAAARKAFKQAAKDAKSRPSARQWLKHIARMSS